MHEPATTLTDLVLALQCAAFALYLARKNEGDGPRRDWVIFFASLGAAALLGALVHGFLPDEESIAHTTAWRATLLAIGITAFAGWRIGAELALAGRAARAVKLAAAALLAAYALVVLLLDQSFRVAVLHYLPSVVFLLICLGVAARRSSSTRLAGAAIGLGITLAAALLQQLRIGIHPVHFDHNALYHVIEMGALVLVFRGALEPGAAGPRPL